MQASGKRPLESSSLLKNSSMLYGPKKPISITIVAIFLPLGPNQLPDILVVVLSTKGVAKPTNTHPIVGLFK